MSDDEYEASDAYYESDASYSSAPSAGPSRVRSDRGSVVTPASNVRSKRMNLQEYQNANPGGEFPWDTFRFYVPEWIPSIIRRHILRRINAAEGRTTKDALRADVIISHRGETPMQRRELQRLPNVRAKETFILYPDWLARVFFSGCIVDPPRYVIWEDHHPLIAMSDLGDPESNLKTMVALERYGAIIVPLEHAKMLCVADDSPLLEMPADKRPLELKDVAPMPISKFHRWREYRRKLFFKRQREIREEEREDRIEEEIHRAAKQGKHVLTRPFKHTVKLKAAVRAPGLARRQPAAPGLPARQTGPPSIGYNNEAWQTRLSEKERRLLGIWIAWHCGDGKNRTSIGLYKNLTAHRFSDPGWTELARGRSASAWRDWFRKFYKLPFPDGKSFGDRVEKWTEEVAGMSLEDALGAYEEAGNSQDGNAPRKRKASSSASPEPFPRRKRKVKPPPRKVRTRGEPRKARPPEKDTSSDREVTETVPSRGGKRRRLEVVVEIPVRRPRPRPA